MCLGSLSCMKQCPSGFTLLMKDSSICRKMLTYTGVSVNVHDCCTSKCQVLVIITFKNADAVLPCILMPAHMCTLTGCFALKGKLVATACQSLCRALPELACRLIPCWFTLLATVTLSVTLKLHAAFISKDYVSEAVAPVVPG